MAKRVKILSIDGGGVKGIISAMILAEIEARTQKPISSLFHLIAGTSVGGIIALGLTKPKVDGTPEFKALDAVKLFEFESDTLFSQTFFQKYIPFSTFFRNKYTESGIQEVMGRFLGDTQLSESLTNVLITSYDIERRQPYFFKSLRTKNETKPDFYMRDIAQATAAAPTFFPPAKIHTIPSQESFALIDGGVFANNPSMCAFAEARTMFPDMTDFLLFSLGTAGLMCPYPYQNVKNWGQAQWSRPLLDVIFDGVGDTVDYQLKHLLSDEMGTIKYLRLVADVEPQNDNLDNTTPENIQALKRFAQKLITEKNREIDAMCTALVS